MNNLKKTIQIMPLDDILGMGSYAMHAEEWHIVYRFYVYHQGAK